ncbi:MAG: hypothetical protein ACLTPN_00980 [Clostridia bacterium]|jgi:hypothetical protein
MTKTELETGDIVELRNKKYCIVFLNEKFGRNDNKKQSFIVNIQDGEYLYLKSFREDLLYLYDNRNFDIMRVFKRDYLGDILPLIHEVSRYDFDPTLELNWDYERDPILDDLPQEMTQKEICEILGKNIKIVEEH